MAKETIDYSKPLKNARYEQFCQSYMATNNATQAAKDAKYSKKTAGSKGEQLLKIIDIKSRLAHLQGLLSEKTGITAERVVREFALIAFGKAGKKLKHSDKIKALENLGKNLGIFGKDNEQRKVAGPTIVVHDPTGAKKDE